MVFLILLGYIFNHLKQEKTIKKTETQRVKDDAILVKKLL